MKVFISYSHSPEDQALVDRVVSSLEKAGLNVWYDQREIFPGDNWAEIIGQGLNQSDAMVVILTPRALEAESVRHDISFALAHQSFKKRLIPVVVGNAEHLPKNRIPWILNHLKTIQLPDNVRDENDLDQIAQALKDAA